MKTGRLLCSAALLTAVLTIIGCGGSPQVAQESANSMSAANAAVAVPDWWDPDRSDPNYLFAYMSASSKDLQIARDKARLQARGELANQIGARITNLGKNFAEEVGAGDDPEINKSYSNSTELISQELIRGSSVSRQVEYPEGNGFRAYVLMEMPIGALQADLAAKIKANQVLYTRFQASQAFQEMERKAAEYEEWKKTQEGN